jgi:hypothetical protein
MKFMNPGQESQHLKRCLGYGAGLLALCMGSGLMFFTLEPRVDTHDIQEIHHGKDVRSRGMAPYPEPLPAPAPSAAHTAPMITHDVQNEVLPADDPAPIHSVEVLAPGKINLTAEQQEILKGRGASWGNADPEAEAILRSIPKEAFTSDW